MPTTIWAPRRVRLRSWFGSLALAALLGLGALSAASLAADAPTSPNDGAQVLQSFERVAPAAPQADGSDQTRRWVMFGLGAPLLLLLGPVRPFCFQTGPSLSKNL